jgi:hypothetical protein
VELILLLRKFVEHLIGRYKISAVREGFEPVPQAWENIDRVVARPTLDQCARVDAVVADTNTVPRPAGAARSGARTKASSNGSRRSRKRSARLLARENPYNVVSDVKLSAAADVERRRSQNA